MKNKSSKFLYIIIICIILILISCSNSKNDNNTENNKPSQIILNEEIIEINQLSDKPIMKEYDMGNIPQNSNDVNKDFILINNTEDTIIINYAVTSCDCTIGFMEDEDGNTSDEFSKTSRSVADMELESNSKVTIHLNLDLTGEEPDTYIKILRVYDDYGDVLVEVELYYNIIKN